MTTLALNTAHAIRDLHGKDEDRVSLRFLLPISLVLVAALDGPLRGIILTALSDAYLQVGVFVAATLILFYGLESYFKLNSAALLARHQAWHVPVAAFLGALPGCGGAVMVMTQFTRGAIGFGSVVATLTATMGDAAFLILARQPQTGLVLLGTGLIAGLLSGYVVDAIHGQGFMRPRGNTPATDVACREASTNGLSPLWIVLLVPGMALGGMAAFQVDLDGLFGPLAPYQPALWLGAGGAMLSLLMWAGLGVAKVGSPASCGMTHGEPQGGSRQLLGRVMEDTSFITTWVLVGFLAYEFFVHWTGINLQEIFQWSRPLLPLLGVVAGLIPGCGPQVLVTTLYLNGLVPFSVQLGNAISNDGDALFPAIAMQPRAAMVATLYSSLPALLLAYGYYWLIEIP